MKGFFINHDFRSLDTFVVAKLAGKLQSRLIGFQSGRAEKYIGHAGEFHQFFGQNLLVGHMVIVATVDNFADLVLQSGHQLGVVVAQRVDRNAAQGIQVGLAVHIPHAAALAMAERNGQPPVGVHHMRGTGFDFWAGDGHDGSLFQAAINKAAQRRLGR